MKYAVRSFVGGRRSEASVRVWLPYRSSHANSVLCIRVLLSHMSQEVLPPRKHFQGLTHIRHAQSGVLVKLVCGRLGGEGLV